MNGIWRYRRVRPAAEDVSPERDPFPGVSHHAILKKVDSHSDHAMPVHKMSDAELAAAHGAKKLGNLRHIPAGHGVSSHGITKVDPKVAHRYPERFAVTATGSHHLGTFKGSSLHKGYDEALAGIGSLRPVLEGILDDLKSGSAASAHERIFQMWELADPESARAYARQRAAMAPPKKKGPFVGPPSSNPMPVAPPKPMKIV